VRRQAHVDEIGIPWVTSLDPYTHTHTHTQVCGSKLYKVKEVAPKEDASEEEHRPEVLAVWYRAPGRDNKWQACIPLHSMSASFVCQVHDKSEGANHES